jgi:hypothetical protein
VAPLYGLSNAGRNGGFGRIDVFVPVIIGVLLLAGSAGLPEIDLHDVRRIRSR